MVEASASNLPKSVRKCAIYLRLRRRLRMYDVFDVMLAIYKPSSMTYLRISRMNQIFSTLSKVFSLPLIKVIITALGTTSCITVLTMV